ncbi:MAG: alkaline phosphatase family protein [Anaerolineae bacterium]|nr:alkaline phosphatase family protein [Anaerolineae bacterium]
MSQSRVIVIGLDGVPLGLLRPWIEAGELPTMHRFLRDGIVGDLESTMPPTSGPSWSSFITGKNPGKTGIYDFLHRAEASYRFPPVNASQRDGRGLWDIMSESGRRVGVFNVPITYPVSPVNGLMVSGWMTPYTARDYTYPPELAQELEHAVGNYRIYPTTTCRPGHEVSFLKASYDLLDMRTRTALYLLERERWDFFMAVIFDTDRVLHQLWHLLDPDHPWHKIKGAQHTANGSQMILNYFQQVDRSLGLLFDAAGEDTLKVIMSDHGMGSAHNFVVLNNWLLQNGFLKLKQRPTTTLKRAAFAAGFTLRNVHRLANALGLAKHAEYKGLYSTDWLLKRVFLSFNDVDWPRSVAYSFGRHYGPIYLNVAGREPQGIVQPGREYDRVREQVIAAAMEFKHPQTGRKMVGQVLKREEVYQGAHLDQAPDLILLPADSHDIFFGLADFGSNRVVDKVYRYSGMHRDKGMLMMMGQQVAAQTPVREARIVDLAPTLLCAMELPIPDDMDGQPLLDLFTTDYRQRQPEYTSDRGNGSQPAQTYTEEEEEQVIERLRGLGYLG